MTLFPMKATFFFFYISLSISVPVMQLYLARKGVGEDQLRTVFWPRIGAQLVGGVVFGLIVDTTGQYLLVFSIQIISSTLLLLPVPWVEDLGTIDMNNSNRLLHDENKAILAHSCREISRISRDKYLKILSESECCHSHTLAAYSNSSLELVKWNNTFNEALFHVLEDNECSWYSVFIDCKRCSPKDVGDPSKVLIVNVSSRLPCQCKEMFHRSNFGIWVLNRFNNGVIGHEVAYGGRQTEPDKNQNTKSDEFLAIMSILLSLAGFLDGGIATLIDSFVLEKSKQNGGTIDYGKQRVWGAIGAGVSSVCIRLYVTGSSNQEQIRFSFAFAFFIICNFIFYLSSFYMVRGTKFVQEENRDRDGRKRGSTTRLFLTTLGKFPILFYILTILVVGIANGAKNQMTYQIINDFEGSESLHGVLVLISSAFDAAAFPFARRIISLIGGTYTAMMFSVGANALRFLIYSYLRSAKHLIFMEPFRCVCFSLLWVAAVYELDYLAPPGLTATMISLLNALYFGVAATASREVFNTIYRTFGLTMSIRGFALALFSWFILMFLYKSIYLRCQNSSYSKMRVKNRSRRETEILNLEVRSPESSRSDCKNLVRTPETWI